MRPRQARRPQTADPAPNTSTINVYSGDPAEDAPHLSPAATSPSPTRTPTEPANAWTAAETITGQLARLDAVQHGQKMKATILALVAANLEQRSEETVWDLPGTCNRSTYHAKWKKNKTFADVLARVRDAAKHHQDTADARAVARASRRIRMASERAAERLEELIDSMDEATARLAAQAILDRAGLETAAKSTQQQIGTTLEEWRQDAERRRSQVEDMIAEMEDEETPDDVQPAD